MPLIPKRFVALLMSTPLLVAAPVLHAEKADRAKPMNIEADALRFDDLKQVSVFTGKVVLTKGTLLIRGARVDVRQDPQGYQYGTAVAEPGGRAFFRQKREGADEFIEGESEVIEYDGRADVVKFIRSAEMRRYRGVTLNDEITGSLITYDNTSDVFTVDGRAPGGGGAGQRVRAVLTPASASGAAPGGAPAPAVPLRASPRLGEVAQ